MVKSYGAFIVCSVCGREPFADDPALECYDLHRYGPDGRISESPKPGEWRCFEHTPPKAKRTARRDAAASPLEALDQLGELLADENANLADGCSSIAEEYPHDDAPDKALNDFCDEINGVVAFHCHELELGLARVRAVIVANAKPVKAKPRRSRRIPTEDLPGQGDWIEEVPTPS